MPLHYPCFLTSHSFRFYIEQRTRHSQKPDVPHFTWETFPKENGYSNIKVTWIPNLNGYPGSHFYAKYKLKGETISRETDPEFLTNELEVRSISLSHDIFISCYEIKKKNQCKSARIEFKENFFFFLDPRTTKR